MWQVEVEAGARFSLNQRLSLSAEMSVCLSVYLFVHTNLLWLLLALPVFVMLLVLCLKVDGIVKLVWVVKVI